jgi:hypothetical protein
MINDPAQVKFINNKFILSTNDKSNPISIIRQKQPGNENDVIIHLSDGTQFDDHIEKFKDLVSITSNKLYTLRYNITVEIFRSFEYLDNCDNNFLSEDEIINIELEKLGDIFSKIAYDQPDISSLFSSNSAILNSYERDWNRGLSISGTNVRLPRIDNNGNNPELHFLRGDFTFSFFWLVLCQCEYVYDFFEEFGKELDDLYLGEHHGYKLRIINRRVLSPVMNDMLLDDFFKHQNDDHGVFIDISTNDGKYFKNKFTSDEKLDIISLFKFDLNDVE